MDTEESNMSVLLLPWLAHGHITPFLELAKQLAKRHFHIYLCSTPIILSSMKNRITDEHSHSIDLVELHLPSLPNLPPHHHTTNGLPHHLMSTLKKAYEMAIPNFTTIVKTLTPDFVIYDFNQPWVPTIAAAHNIPAVQFISSGAAVGSYFRHKFNKPGIEFPFPAIKLSEFHENQFRRLSDDLLNQRKPKEAAPNTVQSSRPTNVILFNTFRELEGKYIDYLSILAEKKIVPVGPLIHEAVDATKETEIMNWLDEKGDSSTVFVSFGSEYFLSKEEIEEVAHGLELSGVNFIWVVRFPVGERVDVEEILPEGFVDKVRERGLVVDGWAPQAQILAHSSTGGFVSHCGWNSILESLKFGIPIVAMPMRCDQPLNARLLEEVGVGMEVEVESDEDGRRRLNREKIAQVIRKVVVVEKSGDSIWIKAREFSNIIGLKGEEGFDEVVEELVQLCQVRKLV